MRFGKKKKKKKKKKSRNVNQSFIILKIKKNKIKHPFIS